MRLYYFQTFNIKFKLDILKDLKILSLKKKKEQQQNNV